MNRIEIINILKPLIQKQFYFKDPTKWLDEHYLILCVTYIFEVGAQQYRRYILSSLFRSTQPEWFSNLRPQNTCKKKPL